jgi:hypothetical protein
MVEARWWHRLGPPIAASLLVFALAAAPVRADYQASVYSNITAFDACDGTDDTISADLKAIARDAYRYLGYTTATFTVDTFTKAKVLARNPNDVGVYVHSHGDFYGSNDIQGFRVDGGDCSQPIVYATDIKKGRAGGANLVVMSTCHLGEAGRNGYASMSEVYGIERKRSDPLGGGYRGPEFFLGYKGLAWTADQLRFERAFFDYATRGKNLGDAFKLAMVADTLRFATDPTWFGTYTYSGSPAPVLPCDLCL